MSNMNIQRIKQTQLHKDILEVFGSMANAARRMKTGKPPIYDAKDNPIPDRLIPKFIEGFDAQEKATADLRKKLIGNLTKKDIAKLKRRLGLD